MNALNVSLEMTSCFSFVVTLIARISDIFMLPFLVHSYEILSCINIIAKVTFVPNTFMDCFLVKEAKSVVSKLYTTVFTSSVIRHKLGCFAIIFGGLCVLFLGICMSGLHSVCISIWYPNVWVVLCMHFPCNIRMSSTL